jgi:hypothetical protein
MPKLHAHNLAKTRAHVLHAVFRSGPEPYPDPVGSVFYLGLDPGSAFEIRIRIPDPDV